MRLSDPRTIAQNFEISDEYALILARDNFLSYQQVSKVLEAEDFISLSERKIDLLIFSDWCNKILAEYQRLAEEHNFSLSVFHGDPYDVQLGEADCRVIEGLINENCQTLDLLFVPTPSEIEPSPNGRWERRHHDRMGEKIFRSIFSDDP